MPRLPLIAPDSPPQPTKGAVGRKRITPVEMADLLARAEHMTIEDLREEWPSWLSDPMPALKSRDVLRRLLTWKVQALVHGGYDNETKRLLKQLIADHDAARPLAPRMKRRLLPGTVLSRDWKGRIHKVTVEARGFSYEGRSYASLSEIAREITGTRWSGPRLFGLEGERS